MAVATRERGMRVAAWVAVVAGLAGIVEAVAAGGHPIWEGGTVVAGVTGGVFLAYRRFGPREPAEVSAEVG
jgi:hypothetical protein